MELGKGGRRNALWPAALLAGLLAGVWAFPPSPECRAGESPAPFPSPSAAPSGGGWWTATSAPAPAAASPSAAPGGEATPEEVSPDVPAVLPLAAVEADASAVWQLLVAADGASCLCGGEDGRLRLAGLPGLELRREFAAHRGVVNALAWAAGGREVLSAGLDEQLVRTDLVSGVILNRTHVQAEDEELLPATGLVVLPGEQEAVLGDYDGRLQRRALATGELRAETPRAPAAASEALLAEPGRGRWLLAGGHDGRLRVWRADLSACLAELPAHEGEVRRLALSPDGGTLLTGGSEGRILAWSLAPGEAPVLAPRGLLAEGREAITVLAFLPSASRQVVAGDERGALFLRDLEGGAIRRRFAPPPGVGQFMLACGAVTPDGRYLAGGASGTNAAGRLVGWLVLWSLE